MKFELTFASVQAERETEKMRNTQTEGQKSCKVWLETSKHIL